MSGIARLRALVPGYLTSKHPIVVKTVSNYVQQREKDPSCTMDDLATYRKVLYICQTKHISLKEVDDVCGILTVVVLTGAVAGCAVTGFAYGLSPRYIHEECAAFWFQMMLCGTVPWLWTLFREAKRDNILKVVDRALLTEEGESILKKYEEEMRREKI